MTDQELVAACEELVARLKEERPISGVDETWVKEGLRVLRQWVTLPTEPTFAEDPWRKSH